VDDQIRRRPEPSARMR